MEAYDIKKTVISAVEGPGLERLAGEIFGGCDVSDGKIVVRFGAVQPLTAWLDGKKLCVEIVTDRNVDNEIALATISKKNAFLERATGYTAKERLKKLKKGGA